MFDFYYQQGNSRRKLFQAKGSHCSIGSARNNDLIIDGRQMSKRHAELRLEQDGVYLRDLGSLSGTWINRARIVDHGPLCDLDDIEVGDISVSLRGVRMTNGSETGVALSAISKDQGARREPSKVETHSLSGKENKTHNGGALAKGAFGMITGQSASSAVAPEEHDVELDQTLAYWARIVHEQLLFQMDLRRKDVNRMSDEQLRDESSQLISEIINSLSAQFPDSLDRALLSENVLNEAVGLGPLEQFLKDESITEIMVNNYREIFIERAGRLERSTAHFSSDATVFAVIERIITPLGRRIDESSPIVDARLKDGSRVNAVIPPLALKGPSLTIRKFPSHRLQFSDLVACDSVSESMVEFLRVCVEMRKNIVVSGGTGSGKTTLLNVLSNFIPFTERIVTIEDAAELQLVQPNLVSLESRPSNLEGKGEVPIRDLVRNSLRMRPDRIVVGECRGGEAIDMLQAMNTGHDGSLTTIHANTPRDVLSRLEVLVLMAGMDLPVTAIREQVAAAVNLIIQQTRFPCGSRKITRITEVVGVESGTVQLQDIFRFEQQGVDEERRVRGFFSATGAIPTFYEELRSIGVDVDLSFFNPGSQEESDVVWRHDGAIHQFSLVTYFCIKSTTQAVDQYSEKLSQSAESNMRKLFLFADTRKLLLFYIAALILIPLLLLIAGSGLVLAAFSVAILFVAPRLLFMQLAKRRRVSINQALPDALTQIAGAMRAGSTFTMAMQSYVDEYKGPLGQELSLLLREQRVGARLEDALDSLAERVQSEEMDLVVAAALIANDIGGNLAEILQSLAETIRRKLEMEGKVGALTAQGRLQGMVVSALPFVILIPLIYFEPEATLPIFSTLLGWMFLAVIIIMVTTGSLFIRKIVNVDI